MNEMNNVLFQIAMAGEAKLVIKPETVFIKHRNRTQWFNSDLDYVGRLCHRRECPSGSVQCIGCGDIPFIQHIRGFKFTPQDFYSSPFEILFNCQSGSQFIRQREKYGIEESREFEQFEDVMLECWECGSSFAFTGGEQKYYQQRGFQPPKRCESCRMKKQMVEFGLHDYDEIERFEVL